MTMAEVSLKNLWKRFDDFAVVKGIGLDIPDSPGESRLDLSQGIRRNVEARPYFGG